MEILVDDELGLTENSFRENSQNQLASKRQIPAQLAPTQLINIRLTMPATYNYCVIAYISLL